MSFNLHSSSFFRLALFNCQVVYSEREEEGKKVDDGEILFFVLIIFAPFHTRHASNDIAKESLLKSRWIFSSLIKYFSWTAFITCIESFFFQCRRLKVMSASLTVCTEIWRKSKNTLWKPDKVYSALFSFLKKLMSSALLTSFNFNVDLGCFWDNHFMQKEPVAVRADSKKIS